MDYELTGTDVKSLAPRISWKRKVFEGVVFAVILGAAIYGLLWLASITG
jgi:hypothetical protein